MDKPEVKAYRRKDGLWGWHLIATNGEIVGGDGGQGFGSSHDAVRGYATMERLIVDHRPSIMVDESYRPEV